MYIKTNNSVYETCDIWFLGISVLGHGLPSGHFLRDWLERPQPPVKYISNAT